MRQRKSLLAVVSLVLALFMLGCAGKAPVKHPGAINDFDSYAFDTLLTAHGALNEAKAQAPSHPEAKELINQAIASYNSAQAAYKIYHASGSGDYSGLQQQLGELVKSIAQVQKAFGVTL